MMLVTCSKSSTCEFSAAVLGRLKLMTVGVPSFFSRTDVDAAGGGVSTC